MKKIFIVLFKSLGDGSGVEEEQGLRPSWPASGWLVKRAWCFPQYYIKPKTHSLPDLEISGTIDRIAMKLGAQLLLRY